MYRYVVITLRLFSDYHDMFLVFVFIEFLAYTWYTLSYIPYARDAVKKVVGL